MAELTARDQQRNILNGLFDEMLGGHLQIAVLKGEAGAGKTALVRDAILKAKERIPDLVAAGSKCYSVAGGQEEPYFPFLEILDQLWGKQKGKEHIYSARMSRAIAELAPDWLQIIPGPGNAIAAVIRTIQWGQKEFSSIDNGASIDVQRRMVQYVNALEKATQVAPVLLWIDDMQWADNASLDMISFIADHCEKTRLMLLCAYRSTELNLEEQTHPLTKLLSKLAREKQYVEIDVPAFSLDDLKHYLISTEHVFPDDFVLRLWKNSGGNPLFIQEYINLLHQRDLVKRDHGKYRLLKGNVEIEVPKNVQEVIHQRLNLLNQDFQRLLSYGSVQGEKFATKVLANLLDYQERDILEKLNSLERMSKLIHELEEQQLIIKVGSEYQFVHALTQQVLYDDLGSGQRQYLHKMIAGMLAELYGTDSDQYALDLAIHNERGRSYPDAIHYYLIAARNALAKLALNDTLGFAQNAINLIQRLQNDCDTTAWLLEANTLMAQAYYWKTEYATCIEVCQQAEKLCEAGCLNEQMAQLLYWEARALRTMAKPEASVDVIRKALDILSEETSNQRLQGNLYAYLGSVNDALTQEEVQQALDKALRIADQNHLPDVMVRVLIEKAWKYLNVADLPEEAFATSQKALEISKQHGFTYDEVTCHRLLSYSLIRLKRGAEAYSHDQQAVDLATKTGLPLAKQLALYSYAISCCSVGEDWEAGLEAIHKSLAIAEQFRTPPTRNLLGAWFNISFGLGYWQEAEEALNMLQNQVGSTFSRGFGYYQMMEGHLAYAKGMYAKAAAAYKTSLEMYHEYSISERDYHVSQLYLGFALLAQGQVEPSRRIFNKAKAFWEGKHPGRHARSLQGLARVSLAKGAVTQSIRLLDEAQKVLAGELNGQPWPIIQRVQLDRARSLLLSNQPGAALDSAIEAYKTLKQIGHFLSGDAGYLASRCLQACNQEAEANSYYQEAQLVWQKIGVRGHAEDEDLTNWLL